MNMKKLNIDLDKYMVYQNSEGTPIAAVDKKHQSKMDDYYRKYDRFQSAPDDLTIEDYRIVYDQSTDSFETDARSKMDFPINELEGTIIKIFPKY